MIPKAWAPYFLEPQSPWEAFQTYKMLLRTILEAQRDFIKAWLAVACTHVVQKDELVLKAKWQNLHADQRMLEWML
jgi:hypothetical protein